MKNRKQYIGSMIFLAALIGMTFYFFLKDNHPYQLLKIIKSANPLFMIAGFLAMLGFVACEAVNTKTIMKSWGKKLSFFRCWKYAFVGFYFSSITPSASGGQPMQIYYMTKDGIGLSYSSLNMLILVAIYQIVMLGYALVMFFLKASFVLSNIKGLGILLIYGIVINLLLITAIFAMIFSKTAVKKFLMWGIGILQKLKLIKHPEKAIAWVDHQIEDYQKGAEHIKKNPMIFIKVFLMTVLQMTCLFIVPFFVYRAFGLSEYSLLDVLAAQSLLTVAVSSLPLPGAVGASESGFMILFKIFFSSSLLLPAMMLSRGISFYLMLLVSGTITAIAHILSRKKANMPVFKKVSGVYDC